MKKLIALVFLLAGIARAQTTVTATVSDINGNLYANGTVSAYTVVNTGQASITISPVIMTNVGTFSLSLASNLTYIFTVCAPPVLLGQQSPNPPPLLQSGVPSTNPAPQLVCFASQPIAISGATQDISGQLSAAAQVLGPKAVSGGISNGGVSPSNTSCNTFYTSTAQVSGDCLITDDGSGNLGVGNSVTVNGPGTGIIKLTNGIAPPAPPAGTSTLYTDTNGVLRCLLPGNNSCLLGGAAIDSPFTYTIYPATNSTCTIYSATGTNYCAQNGDTGSIDFQNTDAAALLRSAIANISGVCGTIFFKTGIYNLNSLVQETTGGFSNFYAIGVPGNVSTNQYCTWTFAAEGFVNPVGGSPVQTAGVILNLTSTAINSVAAHSKIMELWVRPPTGSGAIGPAIFINNLDFRVPDNQRGCETQVDLTQAVTSEYTNVNADTNVQPSSLALPLQDASCTPASWGGDVRDAGGLIQLTTTNAGQAAQYMNNVNAWGGDVCIDIRGEHAILINTFGDNCNHAIDYGVRGPQLFHDGTFIGSGWQESKRGLTLGGQLATGTLLDIYGLDIEDATSSFEPIWVPVYHALETNSGRTYGQMTYTSIIAGTGLPFLLPSLFDDGTQAGEGSNFVQTGYSAVSRLNPPVIFTDNFTRANATSLGSGWTVGSNIGITSNTAAPNSAGTGVSEYWGAAFSTDQFAQMTISTMNTNAGTYAQLEINQTGTDLGANRVDYEYFCSRSAGAGQYELAKHSGGVLTTFLTSTTAVCPTPPFTMEIRHQGSLICAYMNGALDTNLGGGAACAIDSSLTGGVPSIDLIENVGGGIAASKFVGGSLPPLHGTTIDSIFGQANGWSGLQEFTTIGTTTNCAVNSVSPAACGSAAAGAVVIPTTTTTYTINTTAVTANSRIFLQPMTWASNLPSAPTCVAPAAGFLGVSAVTAGTSITVTLPSTTGTVCLNYNIIN